MQREKIFCSGAADAYTGRKKELGECVDMAKNGKRESGNAKFIVDEFLILGICGVFINQAEMLIQVLKSKILRAEATDVRVDYEGSLAIDEELMDKVGMLPYEKILVGNIANGKRFETYAIPAPRGSRTFSIRGAAAHLGAPGDLLVIMSFAQVELEKAKDVLPRTITLAERNTKIVKSMNMIS